MSVRNLFYWSYWFSQPYIARDWLAIFLWVVVGLVVAGGIGLYVARYYEKDHLKKEVLRRFAKFTLTAGIIGLVWLFFRQQRIPFLAWRFWLVLAAGILGYWLSKIIRYMQDRLPAIKAEQAMRERRNKYLPKAKK